MEETSQEMLTFHIDNQRFAFDIRDIDRIIRSVAITKLKDAPPFIEGVIDFYGEIIAVINFRKRLGYPIEDLKLSDRFIIVKTTNRKLALIVDDVEKLLHIDKKKECNAKDIDVGMQLLKFIREDEGIIYIYDIESLLNQKNEIELEKFIKENFSSVVTL